MTLSKAKSWWNKLDAATKILVTDKYLGSDFYASMLENKEIMKIYKAAKK